MATGWYDGVGSHLQMKKMIKRLQNLSGKKIYVGVVHLSTGSDFHTSRALFLDGQIYKKNQSRISMKIFQYPS